MVAQLVESPVLSGMVAAGVLAAIMSSLDSQFVCLGTMFTNDVVLRVMGKDRFSDSQTIMLGRVFIVVVVAATYGMAVWLKDTAQVFDLGVWCFSGFAGLFPVVVGAVFWRRMTKAAAVAAVITMGAAWIWLFCQDIVFHKGPEHGEFLIAGMMPVALLVAISTATVVIVSLITKPPADEIVDRFFPPKSA
jgi:SSS family solute:Na+ symporter